MRAGWASGSTSSKISWTATQGRSPSRARRGKAHPSASSSPLPAPPHPHPRWRLPSGTCTLVVSRRLPPVRGYGLSHLADDFVKIRLGFYEETGSAEFAALCGLRFIIQIREHDDRDGPRFLVCFEMGKDLEPVHILH